jgi:hypothetical protein
MSTPVSLAPTPVFKAWNNLGFPLAFGTLSSFVAGSSTPQATYVDSTGTTQNTNPIVLNARGEANVWLATGLIYKLVLKDPFGNQIWAVDNVPGGVNLSQQSIGGILYPQTSQEASLTVVNFFYPPGNVLRYTTNSAPGTTDMTTAVQSAVTQMSNGGAGVFFPAGTYLVTATITLPAPSGVYLSGAGMGLTVINHTGTSDLFQLFNGPTTGGGPFTGQITIKDMMVTFGGSAASSGSAFNLRAPGILPSITMRDVTILANGAHTWSTAITTTTSTEMNFNRVLVFGNSALTMNGWTITQVFAGGTENNDSSVVKINHCSTYNVGTAFAVETQSATGIQGVEFTDCDITIGHIGVLYTGPGAAYFPPQLTWLGGQINVDTNCFNLTNVTNFFCHGAELFNSGSASTAQHMLIIDTNQVSVIGNQFMSTFASGAGADGITFGTNGPLNGGTIANNYFQFPGSTENAINLIASTPANFTNLSITGNTRQGGLVTVNTSTLTSTTQSYGAVLIKDNQPIDQADVYQTLAIAASATTASIVPLRTDYVVLNLVSGTAALSTLTPRKTGDRVTLFCTSANVSLVATASAGANQFQLTGNANYTFTAGGSMITLVYRVNAAGTSPCWCEESRN